MDLKDYVLVIKGKTSVHFKRITIISLILLVSAVVLTFVSHQNLSSVPQIPITTHRSIGLLLIVFQMIILLARNIAKHRLIKGILYFIPKAFLMIVVVFIVFLRSTRMLFFGVEITDMFSIVLASFYVSIMKLFIS